CPSQLFPFPVRWFPGKGRFGTVCCPGSLEREVIRCCSVAVLQCCGHAVRKLYIFTSNEANFSMVIKSFQGTKGNLGNVPQGIDVTAQ
ncbi:MAG: hypothetical protein KAJ09_15145, partial [Deltaproteobacteria bacterium]|nr:hypothetical protein [Deltaproteobacteria bacterium]